MKSVVTKARAFAVPLLFLVLFATQLGGTPAAAQCLDTTIVMAEGDLKAMVREHGQVTDEIASTQDHVKDLERDIRWMKKLPPEELIALGPGAIASAEDDLNEARKDLQKLKAQAGLIRFNIKKKAAELEALIALKSVRNWTREHLRRVRAACASSGTLAMGIGRGDRPLGVGRRDGIRTGGNQAEEECGDLASTPCESGTGKGDFR